ncbi:MAG: hypothetical protein IPL53_21510 [Ignavibacteria bacterium]|nr:hypothetical protein [Ignavibacteria bacterium]
MDIATAIHYYEAILASLAILVWHFYFIFLNPDVYPMNKAWLSGFLTKEEMERNILSSLKKLKKPRKKIKYRSLEEIKN